MTTGFDGADLQGIVPQWPAPPCVRAFCTTRGTASGAKPFAGLNLGLHVGDCPATVLANRARLAAYLDARPVFLQQEHGVRLLHLTTHTPDGQVGDAAATTQSGLACTVMVADCLPILLCARAGHWVAALHAGWRGLAGGPDGVGVVEQAVKEYSALAHVEKGFVASELIAWLGPCIGPQVFEVGDDVRRAFMAHQAQAAGCFVPHGGGRWLANLAQLARLRLSAAGVRAVYGNAGASDWCTVQQTSRFFSYRRDGRTGRMAACIWRV